MHLMWRQTVESMNDIAQAHKPLLCTDDLCVQLDKQDLLCGISFAVSAGEVVGLIGPNGAGKSTLLKVISGLWTPASGSIAVLDQPLSRYSTRQIAQIVAQVPQITALDFPFTVRQVVLMGRNPYLSRFELETERDRQVAEQAMQRTQTTQFAERLVGTLSGGERQRVLIARALTQEPRLLLLDEPTANLDIQHQISIFNLIRTLAYEDGLGVITAVHDLELAARFCDRLVLLNAGAVWSAGSPDTVLSAKNLRAVYGVNAQSYLDPLTGHLRLAVLDRTV